ncbi:MAG: RIP metalloprotease RseP [Candidatus Magasanikbacteria bacterium]|jgi:regulator of sigma E protease
MVTILIFILILGILVLVHEFGHFITARKSGMKVFEFGFGYPPRAVGVYRDPQTKKFKWVFGRVKSPKGDHAADLINTVGGGEREEEFSATLYSLNWLPIGGFCKIKGENGEGVEEKDSFGYQKAWKKIIVLCAGVVMNFFLAVLVLGLGFMIGLPTDFSQGVDRKAIIVEQPQVIIQQAEKGMPAEKAGLQFGDKVLKINEEPIETTQELIDYVSTKSGETLLFTIDRSNEEKVVSIIPEFSSELNRAVIGIMPADAGIIRYPWYLALYKGLVASVFGLLNIFIAFYLLIKNLVMGQGLLFDVSGPVGIATVVGQSAKLGFNYLLNVTAMISLSLAAINILPIPALDGGRILFILIAKVIRRPVPMKYEQLAHTLGFVLLMLLVVVVTWRDVARLF